MPPVGFEPTISAGERPAAAGRSPAEIYDISSLRVEGGYTLVTLPRTVTPYRDGVDGTRDRVTYQMLVTR